MDETNLDDNHDEENTSQDDDLGFMTDEEYEKNGEDDEPNIDANLDALDDSEWDDESFDCD